MSVDEKSGFGILTQKGQRISYIYLCGIMPLREIHLSESITLCPAISSPAPEDMIDCIMKNGNGDEFSLGILISTLRSVTAQLKIAGEDAETLAVNAWNSQTLCVLLSALLNCEVAWYFQADMPVEQFCATTKVSLIFPQMHTFPGDLTIISEEQGRCIEESISTVSALDSNERFSNATNALWNYRNVFRPAVQLSIIWGGIESLLPFEKQIKKNLSIAASRFLRNDDSLVQHVKDLYVGRCKAVHEYQNAPENVLSDSVELLHKLVIKCIETHSTPNIAELLKEKQQ